jgi:cellulose synthase/poly-beta-1,6-N-acetylglucosamine synthase-like glycosyltransferase
MFLPKPPTDGEVLLYSNPNKAFLYSFGILSTGLLITGGFLFASQRPSAYWFGVFLALNSVYLAVSYLVGFLSRPFDFHRHYFFVKENNDYLPSVDVYLPTCGEDLRILQNSYHYIEKLKTWPRVNVYVLDDSGRPEVCTLALSYGFTYHSREDKGVLKKSGNVRSLFPQTDGDLILILDADFCPRPDMLKNMIPYFKDQSLGILQTPQFFDVDMSMPWIQRGSATIQELFYRLIQVNRDYFGAAICVGTNALYRRKALEPLGGTYPIEHSEDVHTGFALLKDGWDIRYIPVSLASGVCPANVSSFASQQYRWCTGSTSLFLNRDLFWKTKLSFMQRASFLSGMLYYQATGLGVIFIPLPAIYMAWFYIDGIFWWNYLFSLPSLVFGLLHMKLWNKQPYGVFALRARLVSYWAHLFALCDRLTGSVVGWAPTNTKASNNIYRRFKWLMPIWTLGTLALGITGIVVNGSPNNFMHYAPYLAVSVFYATINISTLVGGES